MECAEFVEEKIGDSWSPEFRAHLALCSDCARDVEELREVKDLYRSASAERYRGPVPRRGRGAWMPMAGAAALLFGILALALHRPSSVEPPKPETSNFVRMSMEPWRGDARVDREFSEVWDQLARMEGTRR